MENIKDIVKMLEDIDASNGIKKDYKYPPDKNEVITIIDKIKALLFTSFFLNQSDVPLEVLIEEIKEALQIQIARSYAFVDKQSDGKEESLLFINALPQIKEKLYKDITAIYLGDPAAKTKGEIALCYPGFYAILVYRLANLLYKMKVPLLPRIMTEHAHSLTGIDINAGAEIGEYFFIDHGTGIVIGETTVIGNNVKLYQGVTLGARSFELDENGNPIKDIKRHPTIGNNVIIYANATILGGETVIGDNSVIGANVWLTKSVAKDSKVYYAKENKFK